MDRPRHIPEPGFVDRPTTVALSGSGVNSPVIIAIAPGGTDTVGTVPGGTAYFGLVITGVPGFTGTVRLGCISSSPQVTCIAVPSTITIGASGSTEIAVGIQTYCQGATTNTRFIPSFPMSGFGGGFALLVIGTGLVSEAQGGIGYIVFSIAMTVGRLGGDAVVARIGDRTTLVGGSLLAVAGLAVLLLAPSKAVAIAGFLLIGLGASNLVPVLFRGAATQTAMPTGLAVASITTAGYAGVLVGPAGIGFVAHAVGLPMAFWMLAALMCLVTLSARAVTAK